MRIAFWGNMCNNFYGICKAIKESEADIDCHLFIPKDADIQNLPESEDVELVNNYPFWIHKDVKWNPELFFKKFDTSLVKELSKFDAVILSGRGISLAPFIKTKVIFYVTGGDLTIAPYYNRVMTQSKSLFSLLLIKVSAFFQKKGIKKASEIWVQPFQPFQTSLQDLEIDKRKVKNKYFPLLIDQNKIKFKSPEEYSIDSEILSVFNKYKFTIFHPSRIMMNKTDFLVKSGQWKQNELLLFGLKYVIDNYGVKDIGIILPDRMANDFEKDDFMQIVNDLELKDHVSWIKPSQYQGFTKFEMLDLYSMSDLVVDEFGIGWFGSIVLEAAACAKPVMCYVDEQIMNKLYPWHPILSANTKEDIGEAIRKLYNDQAYKEELGQQSKKWIQTFHSFEGAGKLYVEEFAELQKSIS